MSRQKFEIRRRAIVMRKKGESIVCIEKSLGVARSTLSGWFKEIKLSARAKSILEEKKRIALRNARKQAVQWHNLQKKQRFELALAEAQSVLENIDIQDNFVLELTLALLYHGEGSKGSGGTSIGNSDPRVLLFFIAALRRLYNCSSAQIRCELHLRMDQDPVEMVDYWSKTLKVPAKYFYKPIFDTRTIGKPTYETYKGVCVVRYPSVAIQRRLMYISEGFCDRISNSMRG